ncbi:hypothetical protein MRX96_020576 [Rhipicephalus microplus]
MVKMRTKREKPKLRVGGIPRIFENLPAYLTKPKPRSHSQRENPPAKRRRVSSPNNDGTAAAVSSSTEPCDPEAAGDDGVLMFDEMSVRKSVHIRESDMALLGKVDFAEHT